MTANKIKTYQATITINVESPNYEEAYEHISSLVNDMHDMSIDRADFISLEEIPDSACQDDQYL